MQQLLKQFKKTPVLIRCFFVGVTLFVPNLTHAFSVVSLADSTVGFLISKLAQLIFSIVNRVVVVIATILDVSVEYFVLDMAEKVNEISAIEGLWQTFRDLGNIAFIGVLLYIAIRTILDVGNSFNTKRLLIRLVIVALFVNFSLFATKVVIDTSNVVALQFYNSIQVEGCGEDECNLSHFFADAVSLSSVHSEAPIADGSGTNTKVAMARVLGILFLSVAGFVMGAIAFLLIIRFGVLILLMVASPLAFIAFILPGVGIGQKWIDELLSQSFFAPAVFAMIYVVARLASGLKQGIIGGGNTDLMAVVADGTLEENVGIILVFIIMTALMMASLFVAKKMGGQAAQKSIKLGKQTRNWGQAKIAGAAAATARSTVGRASQRASESSSLKDAAKKGGVKGYASRQALKLSNWGAQSSFDARNTRVGKMTGADDGKQRAGGFREVIEEKKKQRQQEKEQIERLSPEEEEKVEKAKMKKQEAEHRLDKREKELDKERDKIKEDLTKLKDEFNKDMSSIDSTLSTVQTAIKDRERLYKQRAEAREEGDEEREQEIQSRIDNLTNDIDGVDNADDLEEKRNKLQEKKHIRQNNYNDKKIELEKEKSDIRQDKIDAQEATKEFKKEMDKIIEVGNERGEEFVETMLEQQSILDSAMSKAGMKQPGGGTTRSRANRQFATENVGDVKYRKYQKGEKGEEMNTQERISQKLPELGEQAPDLSDTEDENSGNDAL